MNEPKRHHYLPQFYLEGFCRNGGLWVYDRDRDEFRFQTPKNTALKSHYYSVEGANGSKRTDIETYLSQVENRASQVMAKLLTQQAITEPERAAFALFVAFMMNRVPDFEKSMNAIESHVIKQICSQILSDEGRVQAVLDRMERNTGEKPEASAKELAKIHADGQFDVVMHRNESLRLMLSLSIEIANWFQQMEWVVLHSSQKTSFITTDNPAILTPPMGFDSGFYGVGILTTGARKYFPLSQSACLVICDHGNHMGHLGIDKQAVRGINLVLASQSDRFVIGRDESLVRSVVTTTRLKEWKRTGRFSVG
jgi:hypothetical protein